jgi:hypothetical protein
MSVLKPLSKITITDLWKEVKDEESIWGDLKARKYQRSSEERAIVMATTTRRQLRYRLG